MTRRGTGDWRSELDDEDEQAIAPLTRAEAVALFGHSVSQPSRVTPYRVVAAQMAITLCSMLAAGLLSTRPGVAALSALCGGAIGFVPGAWFAWRLGRAGAPSALRWAVAEGIKVAATVALFVAVAIGFREVSWLPLLLTFVLVLKTYWIALFWR